MRRKKGRFCLLCPTINEVLTARCVHGDICAVVTQTGLSKVPVELMRMLEGRGGRVGVGDSEARTVTHWKASCGGWVWSWV